MSIIATSGLNVRNASVALKWIVYDMNLEPCPDTDTGIRFRETGIIINNQQLPHAGFLPGS
jgi:hypothetical protein